MKRFTQSITRIALAVLSIVCFSSTSLFAQSGSISGKVTEIGGNTPIPGVNVRVTDLSDTTRSIRGYANAQGWYKVKNLAAGSYRVTFSSVGYQAERKGPIGIQSGEEATLDVSLVLESVTGNEVIVSASRREEKIIDAPASVTLIGAREIRENIASSPMDHLSHVQGIDVAKSGLMQQNVTSRGFNNHFTSTLLVMTDNRIASVPSLRANISFLLAPAEDDIDHIEVVRGPAAALYGPNAAAGVVNIITKSPLASQGGSVSLSGGSQNVYSGSFRYAQAFTDNFAAKISGQYFRGNDWAYIDSAEVKAHEAAAKTTLGKDTLDRIANRIQQLERYTGEFRADWLATNDLNFNATVGFARDASSIQQTTVGSAQGKDWTYMFYQLRANYDDLFVQAFLNQNDAGKTYYLRTGLPVVDRSTLFVVEAQHFYALSDDEKLTYGVDYHATNPVTDSTINGRNELNDKMTEYGVYLQSETHFFDKQFELLVAARYDKHSELEDGIISPRAALAWKPSDEHNLRFTFNQAYQTPLTVELFLDVLQSRDIGVAGYTPTGKGIGVWATGVPKTGYHFASDPNLGFYMHSPFDPTGSAIPYKATANALWPVIQGLAKQGGANIDNIAAPNPAQVGALLMRLNPEAQSNPTAAPFLPVSDAEVQDIPRLKPTTTQTLELGYKGAPADKLNLDIDFYSTKITNFIGPFQASTPTVFINSAQLEAYLAAELAKDTSLPPGFAPVIAKGIADQVKALPAGTVSPVEASDPNAIIASPRNFGEVNYWGSDIGIDYQLSDELAAMGTFSYMSQNYFTQAELSTPSQTAPGDLSMNAPKYKGSLGLKYRNNEIGFTAALHDRWLDAFKVSSGVFVGDISAAHEVDLTLTYQIPSWRDAQFTLAITNLLDHKHQQFIGSPEIGRLVLGRITYKL